MHRDELAELHYIAPIANVPSILRHGILSNARATPLPHASAAMAAMQGRRAQKSVPGGRRLHEYANLYICGRNPMLYLRRHDEICVLAVSTAVLDFDGVVVTDGNGGGDYARFGRGAAGLSIVDKERTFAEYWTSPDPIEYWRRKAAKCAEVLVPERIDPSYVVHAYVRDEAMKERLETFVPGFTVRIDHHLFFG